MKNEYLELALCDDNWKIKAIAMDVYHGFSKNHVKPHVQFMDVNLQNLIQLDDDKDKLLISDLEAPVLTPAVSPIEKRKVPDGAPAGPKKPLKTKRLNLKNNL
ncbi:hypothetical protein NEOLEDRAFT_1179687 [Neolentinus lepideus HHB14362 ss-1]|uniref:Uncharacterized protein n=1 Tax=Neolentinus lepideus HHB14362 ss-1 TaxID=1314782 RepID=A0A165RKD8_9AGAM|nr:hypothetical protein NEOLEDRAFT_1179687 [Neolentinus lepideus HHB14362 ss-1]